MPRSYQEWLQSRGPVKVEDIEDLRRSLPGRLFINQICDLALKGLKAEEEARGK